MSLLCISWSGYDGYGHFKLILSGKPRPVMEFNPCSLLAKNSQHYLDYTNQVRKKEKA
jgi:hypothetical protein